VTKIKVYIVFKEINGWEYSGNEFIGVFFDRSSAEVWIAKCARPNKYFIETYEQPEAGMASEVFD
jgi:hypothetical protein